MAAAVYLYTTNTQLADSVVFGPQIADLSLGINGGVWNLLVEVQRPALPIPPMRRSAIRQTFAINEWMAAPSSGDDWFELYNSDSFAG